MIEIQPEVFWTAVAAVAGIVVALGAYVAKVSKLESRVENLSEGLRGHEMHCHERNKNLHERLDATAQDEDLKDLRNTLGSVREAVFEIRGVLNTSLSASKLSV